MSHYVPKYDENGKLRPQCPVCGNTLTDANAAFHAKAGHVNTRSGRPVVEKSAQ